MTRSASADQLEDPRAAPEGASRRLAQAAVRRIPARIGSYELRGVVGEGSFSVVKLAFHRSSSSYLACKVVEKSRLRDGELRSRFESEIRVHQQLHHPSIVSLCDLLQDDYFFYVFLEFCAGGELFDYVVRMGRLSEPEAKPILREVLQAIVYLHRIGIAHRDLKPENILLSQLGHVKISDFGLSRFCGESGLVDTPCGSPCYASPECLSGLSYDGRTNDCWSIGVILYAMVTGELPWTKRNQKQLFEQIRRGEYIIPGFLSNECGNLISRLLCVDVARRLTAEQALAHPFLNDPARPLAACTRSESYVSLRRVDAFFGRDQPPIQYSFVKVLSQCQMGIDGLEKRLRKPGTPAKPVRHKPKLLPRG
jgi:serine/threonine protein kinase